MLKDFKQFVPSSVCLKCDGCCRFKESDSAWRPHMTDSEKIEAAKPGLVEKIFSKHVVSADGRISATPCATGHLCHFLNPTDNTCGIYHARPFECQLYPFLLARPIRLPRRAGENDQAVIYVHLNCPHIQAHWGDPLYKAYTEYLQEFFGREEVLKFLKNNPSLISDYSAFREELEFVFNI